MNLPFERLFYINWLKVKTFVAFYAATFVAGSSALVWSVGGEWYQSLNQPSFTPPNWLFGPVWTTLYLLMAISAYRVMYAERTEWKAPTIALWALQISLNTIWTPVFFGAYNLGAAFAFIAALWFVLIGCIYFTWRVDRWASVMLWPYFAWVSFASLLNYTFWVLN